MALRTGPGKEALGDQRGQTLVMMALVMLFVMLGLVALVGDGEVMMVSHERADNEALIAAQAGASAIDRNALYSNQIVLDTSGGSDGARQRCESALRGVTGVVSISCSVTPQTVTATVRRQVNLPVPVWGRQQTVGARRTARVASGGSVGGY
jgi:hypothetical protein